MIWVDLTSLLVITQLNFNVCYYHNSFEEINYSCIMWIQLHQFVNKCVAQLALDVVIIMKLA